MGKNKCILTKKDYENLGRFIDDKICFNQNNMMIDKNILDILQQNPEYKPFWDRVEAITRDVLSQILSGSQNGNLVLDLRSLRTDVDYLKKDVSRLEKCINALSSKVNKRLENLSKAYNNLCKKYAETKRQVEYLSFFAETVEKLENILRTIAFGNGINPELTLNKINQKLFDVFAERMDLSKKEKRKQKRKCISISQNTDYID